MRGLKIAAIVAVSLVIVLALLVGYLFLTAEVTVTKISAQGISAANDPAGFEKLKASITEETFEGTLFQKPTAWKNADEYAWVSYTLHIRNGCLVPIDRVEVQIVPRSGDVLQTGDTQPHTLEPKSEGDVSATVLAPGDAHPIRELIVSYYVWGVSFHLKTTYGET